MPRQQKHKRTQKDSSRSFFNYIAHKRIGLRKWCIDKPFESEILSWKILLTERGSSIICETNWPLFKSNNNFDYRSHAASKCLHILSQKPS